MMNVGIVGSSFSSGNINIAKGAKAIDWENYSDDDYEMIGDKYVRTKPFTEILKDSAQWPYYDFHSLAKPGYGSEKYLSDVIHLKKKYDIKILLLEFIENRGSRYRPNRFEYYKEIVEDSNSDLNEFMNLYKDKHGDNMLLERLPGKEWNEYLNNMNTPKSTLFFTLHDIIQTINLCKMLNIFPIIWCYWIWMGTRTIFNYEVVDLYKSFFEKHHLIKFGKYYEAMEYFYKIYDGNQKEFLCDGCHLNDKGNYNLAQNHLLPEIEKLKNYIIGTHGVSL